VRAEPAPVRCAIDTVEIDRIERLLRETPAGDLRKLFSAQELADAGEGAGRAASLSAVSPPRRRARSCSRAKRR
jgi:hypothetical protein